VTSNNQAVSVAVRPEENQSIVPPVNVFHASAQKTPADLLIFLHHRGLISVDILEDCRKSVRHFTGQQVKL